jgi:hypothetical protein
MRYSAQLIALWICCCVSAGVVAAKPEPIRDMQDLHKLACDETIRSESPWRINHLYNCDTKELFIPYQLWTGAPWDGAKDAPCMHHANSLFHVNEVSKTTIIGPEQWQNPLTQESQQVWTRSKTNGSKVQQFTCHEKGIGRVYDSRKPRYYLSGRCKFPAGIGWQVAKRRDCNNTSIEITELVVDNQGVLKHMVFKWWISGYLDHIYRYAPGQSATNAWEQ